MHIDVKYGMERKNNNNNVESALSVSTLILATLDNVERMLLF